MTDHEQGRKRLDDEPNPPDEERRARRARRVITSAQVVLAIAQALDGVLRLFG